ncbi:MAG: hypothetical protein ACYT04_65605 [Nostoc sp.]
MRTERKIWGATGSPSSAMAQAPVVGDRALVAICLFTGCRVSQALKLQTRPTSKEKR